VIVIFCVLWAAVCAVLVVSAAVFVLRRVWLWARRTDVFEPEAAEAPTTPDSAESDEAFTDVQRVFAGQVEADRDGDLITPPGYQPPPVVAGSDLDDGWLFEVYDAIDAYRLGEPIERGAPKERP
jgi:hypothetical protein